MSATRLAAALVLRASREDDRLHLARRCDDMRWFGGVYAFCGGTVDPVDVEVGRRVGGDGERDDPPLGALRSTMLREIMEELALDLRPGAPDAGGVREEDRAQLVRDPRGWAATMRREQLDAVGVPVLRLVTPEFYPRRFDTWFFAACLDGRAEPRPWPAELDEGGWDRPAGWLRRWEAGEILLAPPTVLMLRALVDVPWEGFPAALRSLQEDVEGPVPQAVHNDPAVRVLALRTPTLPPARFTNAFLVGRDPCYLVDPATPHADEQSRLSRALDRARAEGYRPAAVLLTHHHPDHVGAVEYVRARHRLPVFAHAETARRLRFAVDDTLVDGQELELGTSPDGGDGWRLRCVFTPGHAPGHLAFLDSRYRALVAGDMVSTLSSILVHPDDGDLLAYTESLERLAALEPRVVYPSHGPPDARGARVLIEQLEHRRRRTAAVRAAIEAGAHDVLAITERVYVDVPRPMLGYASASVRSILVALARQGHVEVDGDRVRAR